MNPPLLKHLAVSHGTTDPESAHPEPKQTMCPEFYGRNNLSRRVGFMGICFTALFGICCTCVGAMIHSSQESTVPGAMLIPLGNTLEGELISLALNLMVTACTEATGFAHGIALRSTLASERRLRFNTNLRLLSAANGSFHPNGTLCNIVMAILLIVSYSSSLLAVIWSRYNTTSTLGPAVLVVRAPLIVLGVALLLQATIALISVWSADILTWSSTPFDITATLVHHAQIIPEPGRCMHGVMDDRGQGLVRPSAKQLSAWRAHRGVQKVVVTLWLLVVVYVLWGIVVVVVRRATLRESVLGTWSLLPYGDSPTVVYFIPLAEYSYIWVLYVNMAAIQGPLTLALHSSELLVNIVRDERVWRRATTEQGTTVASHPLALVLKSPPNVALLLLKPVLHWMLGLAISLTLDQTVNVVGPSIHFLPTIVVFMRPIQILNYSAVLLIFSLALTVIALRRPSGPQPAAYGHIQTLANLIDEWFPTMWWGHKGAWHAGTSDARLPDVDMNTLYG